MSDSSFDRVPDDMGGFLEGFGISSGDKPPRYTEQERCYIDRALGWVPPLMDMTKVEGRRILFLTRHGQAYVRWRAMRSTEPVGETVAERKEPTATQPEWSELKTKDEWCKHFGISATTFRRWVKEGKIVLDASKSRAKFVRIRRDTLPS